MEFRKNNNDKPYPITPKKVRESGAINVNVNIDTVDDLDSFAEEKKNEITKEHKGTFWYDGKPYHVEITPNYVSVDDLFQDNDNDWHIGRNVYFAQGEDMEYLEEQAGGLYTNTILEFLDSAGALREDRLLENRKAFYNLIGNKYPPEKLKKMTPGELGWLFEESKKAMLGENILANEGKLNDYDYSDENTPTETIFRENMRNIAKELERRDNSKK